MNTTLTEFSIPYMSSLTGRGYHHFSYVPSGTPAYALMLDIGSGVEQEVLQKQREAHLISKQPYVLPLAVERMYRASMFLQQYVFTKVMRSLDGHAGNLRLDVSDYSDVGVALDNTSLVRHAGTGKVFIPGSVYIKPLLDPSKFGGQDALDSTPLLLRILRANTAKSEIERNLGKLIMDRQNNHRGRANMEQFGGLIPDGSEGVEHLAREYLGSNLRQLQLALQDYSQLDPRNTWHDTYKNTEALLQQYPELRDILRYPNPKLLEPEALDYLINYLADKGWHPIHIVGLLAAHYEDQSFNFAEVMDRHNVPFRHAWAWVFMILSKRVG